MADPSSFPGPPTRGDSRDLKSGYVVSDRNGYYDSQNIVAVGGHENDPLIFSVVLHHSENREGGPGLRLFGTRSADGGRTWSPLMAIDDSPGRQSHDGYQLVHKLPDGRERIFVFYGCNEGISSAAQRDAGDSEVLLPRSDMQLREGYYCRFSDDYAQTWSNERYVIPVRRTQIDHENPWKGDVIGMFLCDKPTVIDGAVYMAFQKTPDGAGESPNSEVFFLRSRDLLEKEDPGDATWETLPNEEVGLKPPGGELLLGEEPHVVAVGEPAAGRLFALWRTETGRLAAAYSIDGGESWEDPFWLTYEGLPIERGGVHVMKNPRGAITPHRLRQTSPSGRSEFVLLFYNNGRTERLGYCGRRVYWLTVGRETPDGIIRWHQPEIALWWDGPGFENRADWNPDWSIVDGPGYADWLELNDGRLAFVESNKIAVRFHEVEERLVALLRAQPELCHLPEEGRILDFGDGVHAMVDEALDGPILADLRSGGGFTLTVQLVGSDDIPPEGVKIVSALTVATAALGEEPTDRTISKGYEITVTKEGEIELFVTDGFEISFRHRTHLGKATLWDGQPHVVSFLVDGGPKVLSIVVDERLDDGGDQAPQGWAFLPPDMGEIGGAQLRLAPNFGKRLARFLIYDRALLTSEAIAAARYLLGGGTAGRPS